MLCLGGCGLEAKFFLVIPHAFCGLLSRIEEGTKATVAAEEASTKSAVAENFMMKEGAGSL
jgi:hypothetical protein